VHVYLQGSTPSSACMGAEHHMFFNIIGHLLLCGANSSAEIDSLDYLHVEMKFSRSKNAWLLSLHFGRTITFMFILRFKAAECRAFGVVWNEPQVHAPTCFLRKARGCLLNVDPSFDDDMRQKVVWRAMQ
jgi:hypothetical protein